MRSARSILCAVLAALVASCESTPPTVGNELDVEPYAVELLFAEGLPPYPWQLSAKVLLGPGSRQDVQPDWRSTDNTVVKVKTTGRIETSSRPGTALVIASVGRLRDTVSVTVSAPTALEIRVQQPLLLAAGPDPMKEPYAFEVVLAYQSGRPRGVEVPVQNSDSTIVRLIAPRQLVPLRAGEATLTASAAGFAARTAVRVESRRPILDYAGPNMFIARSQPDTISIAGRDLSPNSVIRWNGEPLETWSPFHRSLRATVPGRFLTPGVARLTVYTPPPGGGESVVLPVFVETDSVAPLSALALDGGTSCALDRTARAYCWGFNNHGQIGDGTKLSRRTPVPTWGDRRFVSLDMTEGTACGVQVSGTVLCWGTSYEDASPPPPTLIPAKTAFASVSVGLDFRCALDTSGHAQCWGANDFAQLGDGTPTSRPLPAPVAGNLAFVTLASGNRHSCGVTAVGEVYCWGQNSAEITPVPLRISLPEPISALDANGATTCAAGRSGAVFCWNGWTGTTVPTRMAPGLALSSVTVGSLRACGIDAEGVGHCWNGPNTTTQVPGGMKWSKLALGSHHGCGIVENGEGYCWGYNAQGQLGTGQQTDSYCEGIGSPCSPLPVRVSFY